MLSKDKPTNANTNDNVNTNTTNVNVGHSKKNSSKSKSRPNWYTRVIVGGIIALALSLCSYYIKNNLDKKSKDHATTIESTGNQIQGKKQN